jgi:hypothetical protein
MHLGISSSNLTANSHRYLERFRSINEPRIRRRKRGDERYVPCYACHHFANSNQDENGNEATRALGLVVARGTLLVVISPVDGSEVIANPFVNQDEED